MRKLGMFLVAGLLATAFAACGSKTSTLAPTCKTKADCVSGDQVCVDKADPLKGTDLRCYDRQCTSNPAKGCATTETCISGLCFPATTGQDAVIEDGRDSVEPGDTTTDTPVTGNASNCKSCTADTDCEASDCLSISAGDATKYCLGKCTANADCPAGFICYPVTSDGKHCKPFTNHCVKCSFDEPCGEDQCCHVGSGACEPCKKQCEVCDYDFNCAKGYRCWRDSLSATGVCVPECGTTDCPTAYTCAANTDGVKICTPNNKDDCSVCKNGQHPMSDGTCVECVNSFHCTAPKTCDTTTHTCTDVKCAAGTKLCTTDNKCHQCCADADCPKQTDGSAGKCEANGTCAGASDACKQAGTDCSTNEYFPACCVVSGSAQCCQCASDADCSKLGSGCTCSQFNSCVKSDGSPCTGSTCPSKCKTDADCPPDSSGASTGSCHPNGFCYKKEGGCDPAGTSCCNEGAGSTCFDLMNLLFPGGLGGIGGGIPGGGTMPSMGFGGYCSCAQDSDCLGGEPCTDMTMLCSLPLIGDIVCVGGSLSSTVPAKMCVDITKLLGGLLGGLGGGGFP